jgi:hypothetical protein
MVLTFRFALLLFALFSVARGVTAATATNTLQKGEALARQVCASCHLFPEPELLDKATWRDGALPHMEPFLGIKPKDVSKLAGADELRAAGVYPTNALLTEEQWTEVSRYFIEHAPEKPRAISRTVPIRRELKQFKATRRPLDSGRPRVSLLHIDSARGLLFASEAEKNTLRIMTASGSPVMTMDLPSPAVSVTQKEDGFYLLLVGNVLPSDAPQGMLGYFNVEQQKPRQILKNLRRPTDAAFADLNGDGREDVVISQFGNRLGQFSWFEAAKDGTFKEHILIERAGAVRAQIHDVNKDGRPDIFVLMAQGREGIYLFLNQGGGEFTMQTIVEKPPTFGFSGFELIDFNGDGSMDLLVTNGDNGDYQSKPKAYHGVRLLLNDGKNHYTETWSYPINGAYKALAADFDGDGDLDIAVISLFPDYLRSPEGSFVYLENKGGMKFEAFTCDEALDGRWITMAAGDMDGDGDTDLVLGSFLPGPITIPIPQSFKDRWVTNKTALLVLENLKSAKRSP